MKLKLSLQRRSRTAKRAPATLLLGAGALVSLLLGVLVLAAAAAGAFLIVNAELADQRLRGAQDTVNASAVLLSQRVAQEQRVLSAVGRLPEVIQALQGGNDTALRALEQRLMQVAFPDALKLRLLRVGEGEVESHGTPRLSYACLEMVRAAERAAGGLPAEAHVFGSAQQHIDMAVGVQSTDGTLGTVLLSYGAGFLEQSLADIADVGFMQVQQHAGGTAQVLLGRGSRSAATGPEVSAAVAGTSWTLIYRPGAEVGVLSEETTLHYAAVFAVAALLLAIVMVAATRRGATTGAAAQGIGAPSQPVSTRPSVAPSATGPAAEGPEVDLLYQPKDALLVEETSPAGEPGSSAATSSTPGNALPAHVFKAYDIRGIVGEALTPQLVYDIGRAIGSEADARGVTEIIVARDGRLSGQSLLEALTKGLRAAGRDVIDIGMVPTPVLYFATQKLGTGSGVMVTGSHNPPEYNGFKIMLGDETLSGESIQRLRERIETGDFVAGKGRRREVNIVPDYVAQVGNDILLTRSLRVVVDCGNGVAGTVAPALLRELGCEVIELYCEIDGNFPNHHPDPGQPKNMQDLIEAVAEHGADVGLAFDGDGDRLGVVAPDGKIIWPDRLMMLYAIDILSRNPGGEIIYDVKCSKKLADVITRHGGQPTMWKTGHSLIKAKMKETGALLAGEMSGHLFFKERWFGFDDALYAAARLMEILVLKTGDQSVSALFAELPDSVNTPELNVKMAEGEHHRFMEQLATQAKFEGGAVTSIDGLRVDFADGWGLVRASNTTPTLVLRFEADNVVSLQRIQEIFKEQMLAVKPDLVLPF